MVSNEWGVPQFLSLISLMTSGFKTLRLQCSSQGFKTGHEKSVAGIMLACPSFILTCVYGLLNATC